MHLVSLGVVALQVIILREMMLVPGAAVLAVFMLVEGRLWHHACFDRPSLMPHFT